MIKARKLSSAMSAAKATGDHMRDWWFGTEGVSYCFFFSPILIYAANTQVDTLLFHHV